MSGPDPTFGLGPAPAGAAAPGALGLTPDAVNLDSPIPAPGTSADTTNSQPHEGVGGFFENLFHGIVQTAAGAGQMLTAVGHDALHAVTGGLYDKKGGFVLDDIAKAIPKAFVGDLENRYGHGFSGLLHSLYTNPMSFVNDALIIGGGIGAFTEGGAISSLIADTAGKTAAEAGVDAVDATATAAKGAEGAIRAGTKNFWNSLTDNVETMTTSQNVVRAQFQNVVSHFLSRDATDSEIFDMLGSNPETATADTLKAADQATSLRDLYHQMTGSDAPRVQKTWWSKLSSNKAVDLMFGNWTGKWSGISNETGTWLKNMIGRLPTAAVGNPRIVQDLLHGRDGTLLHDDVDEHWGDVDASGNPLHQGTSRNSEQFANGKGTATPAMPEVRNGDAGAGENQGALLSNGKTPRANTAVSVRAQGASTLSRVYSRISDALVGMTSADGRKGVNHLESDGMPTEADLETEARLNEARNGGPRPEIFLSKQDDEVANTLGKRIVERQEQLKKLSGNANKSILPDKVVEQAQAELQGWQDQYKELTGSATVIEEGGKRFAAVLKQHHLVQGEDGQFFLAGSETATAATPHVFGTQELPAGPTTGPAATTDKFTTIDPASIPPVARTEDGFTYHATDASNFESIGKSGLPADSHVTEHPEDLPELLPASRNHEQPILLRTKSSASKGGLLPAGAKPEDLEFFGGDQKWHKYGEEPPRPVPYSDHATPDYSHTTAAHIRVVGDDAVNDPQRVLNRIEEETGFKVKVLTDTRHQAASNGERRVTAILQHPDTGETFEVNLLSPKANEVWKATPGMRRQMSQLALRVGDTVDAAAKGGIDDKSYWLQTAQEAQQYSRDMWAGVTDAHRSLYHGGEQAGEMRNWLHDMRVGMHQRITDPALNNGALSLGSAFRNTYNPLRLTTGAEYSPVVKQLIGGDSAMEIAHSREEQGLAAPVYFPLMSPGKELEPARLFQRGRGRGARLGVAVDASLKHNSGQLLWAAHGEEVADELAYRNAHGVMHDLTDAERQSPDYEAFMRGRAAERARTGKEAFVSNIGQAVQVRAWRAMRQQESRDFLNTVISRFGKVVEPGDEGEAEMAGMRVLPISVLNNIDGAQRAAMEAAAQAGAAGTSMNEAVGKALEQFGASQAEILRTGGTQMVAIPQYVLDRLGEHISAFVGTESGPANILKKGTSIYKQVVLTTSPRWLLNHALGNAFYLRMNGGHLSDVGRYLVSKRWREQMQGVMGDHAEELLGRGVYHKGGPLDFAEADESKVAEEAGNMYQKANGATKTVGRGARAGFRGYANLIQTANANLDQAFRAAGYLHATEKAGIRTEVHGVLDLFHTSRATLENAMRVGMDPERYGKAVDEVDKMFTNFNRTSPIAKQVIRPMLAPFWNWYAHAAKVLLTMPYYHPGAARLMMLMKDAQDTRIQQLGINPSTLPGWINGDLLLGNSTSAANMRFMSTAGPNPFNTVLSSPLAIGNPLVNALVAHETGVDSQTGKPYRGPGAVFGSPQQFKFVTGPGGSVTPVPVDNQAPSWMELALREIPAYDFAKDIIAHGVQYNNSSIQQVLSGTGQIRDPKTGAVKYPESSLDAVQKFFGFNAMDVNGLETQQKLNVAKAAAVKQYLKDVGRSTVAATAATSPVGPFGLAANP